MVRRILEKWLDPAVLGLLFLALFALAAIGVNFVFFTWKFAGRDLPVSIASWGAFGSYMGAMLQAFMAAATLLAVLLASVFLDRQSKQRQALEDKAREERRERDEQARAALRLSEIMYDHQFYIKVVAPSWEIASKWMYWEGAAGDRYRQDVAAGMFLERADALRKFASAEAAHQLRFQNVIRFQPHYHPYDFPHPGQSRSELSEHMVLVIWIRFWCHVCWLHDEGMVSPEMVRSLFQDWYSSWRPFMMQLRFVGEVLVKTPGYNEAMAGSDWTPGFVPLFCSQLERVEAILYSQDASEAGLRSAANHRSEVAQAQRVAGVFAQAILELHRS